MVSVGKLRATKSLVCQILETRRALERRLEREPLGSRERAAIALRIVELTEQGRDALREAGVEV